MSSRVKCLIPARGGSKGLPMKNIRPLAGKPLIEYSIQFAQQCGLDPIVTTDDPIIMYIAQQCGAKIAIRPDDLATDHSPIWDTVRYYNDTDYDYLCLLEVPSPARERGDYFRLLSALEEDPEADGAITVAPLTFNPDWVCCDLKDGYVRDGGAEVFQRQQIPDKYRYSGLYLWRTSFIANWPGPKWLSDKHLGIVTPAKRCFSIDTLDEFECLEALVAQGVVELP